MLNEYMLQFVFNIINTDRGVIVKSYMFSKLNLFGVNKEDANIA